MNPIADEELDRWVELAENWKSEPRAFYEYAQFVAEARTALPRLIEEVRRLRGSAEELEKHHEEHYEQPTRCEYDVGKYLHGGLSICVSCRVELEKKFTIAREALEEIKRVGKDPHVTIAKEALERIK